MANAMNKSIDSSTLPESLGSATSAAAPSSTPSSPKATSPTSPSKIGHVKSSLSISSAVDKLSRSLSGSSRTRIESSLGPSVSGTGTGTGTPARGHRRIFSINRKGKGKEKAGGDTSASPSRSTSPSRRSDDDPFITPPSPPSKSASAMATRPTPAWRGDASMRVGTQTLIQALQALPWASDSDHDHDDHDHDPSALSLFTPPTDPSTDEEEDSTATAPHLASSIHTIYRPVARSRRFSSSKSRSGLTLSPISAIPPTHLPSTESSEAEDTAIQSEEEDVDGDDFEEPEPDLTPKVIASAPPHLHLRSVSYKSQTQNQSPSSGGDNNTLPDTIAMTRSGSMATVRMQRRTKLAEKLREIFELDGIEEVVAELPCWLLRSVLLQGYMYLTNNFLCFFAHMPSREDQILKSGSLNKKAQRTKRWIKHWFVLKNDALSWYQSSSDPYFPHGIIDLRYAISCEPYPPPSIKSHLHPTSTKSADQEGAAAGAGGGRQFRIRTNQKTIILSADSVPSREEWVKAIRKVIFKAQNMGDSVKIAIPYSAILDVDKSSAMDFSETIEVKVFDSSSPVHTPARSPGSGSHPSTPAPGDHIATPTMTIDSFFFAYFRDLPAALDQIRDAVRERRTTTTAVGVGGVLDTTTPVNTHSGHGYPTAFTTNAATTGSNQERPSVSTMQSATTSLYKITSMLRPFSSSASDSPKTVIPVSEGAGGRGGDSEEEEFTHINKRSHSSSFVPVTTSSSMSSMDDESTTATATPTMSHILIDSSHTYPPSTSSSPTYPQGTSSSTSNNTPHTNTPVQRPSPYSLAHAHTASSSSSGGSGTSWMMNVPSWLKVPRSRSLGSRSLFGYPASVGVGAGAGGAGGAVAVAVIPPGGKVKEMYTSTANLGSSLDDGVGGSGGVGGDLQAYSILNLPPIAVDDEEKAIVAEKFRNYFAYDEREVLIGYFPGYIFRLLPVYGRLYISLNYFCFKSSGPLTSRTRMALPIRDILSVESSKATRFGHHGLIVIVRGHEELFFEFGAEDKRDAFVLLLERQIDDVRRRLAEGGVDAGKSPGQRDALILEELDVHSHSHRHEYARGNAESPEEMDQDQLEHGYRDKQRRLSVPENLADSTFSTTSNSPGMMFASASSTFLTFKPRKSLHFTFLTIGSRGDVQPYIALARGLQLDGHRVKIATHGEYKEWIEAHDIEYGYVGGDPAELMRICVENGTFTVSFLKEGLQKFRGWLDDLLKTSWEACQGTDVLVESPSAMGGYHIAEALAIPYFRAFTMTWTRTRAYPHAFAVPERKMGGSYNYMSYVMFDQVFWRAISGQINRWRKNVLHIDGTSLDKMEPHKIPFLYNFSPYVVPAPLDWPEWIRVTGYWFLNEADVGSKKWTPPEDLSKFIDTAHSSGRKVVYIGFGSIVVSDPKAMTKCVIEAVIQSGVHAILSKGWSDRLHVKSGEPGEVEEPLPPQIYPISSIPHDWLFQRIDAACHHGGAGTTGASLRAGIPTIIKPFFGDQFFWADRVEALGVGSGVRRLTVDSLADALRVATTDHKQIARAKSLGEQIRMENGVDTAIESIYRDLDYARSLIKRPIHEIDDGEANEHSTIRDRHPLSEPKSGYSSCGSAHGAPSEDWSVISEQGDPSRRSSVSSAHSGTSAEDRLGLGNKRSSIAAAVLSVLPHSLTPGSPRKRTLSTPSE